MSKAGSETDIRQDVPRAQDQLFRAPGGARAKYSALVVGRPGWGPLIKHELVTLFTQSRTPGFAMELMRKDVELFVKAARDIGLDLPLSAIAAGRYAEACETGLADADYTSIAELYERAAELRLAPVAEVTS